MNQNPNFYFILAVRLSFGVNVELVFSRLSCVYLDRILNPINTVVVSSPAAAELFLKTHDLTFADRPHHEASYYLSYEQQNIVFGRYGPYWRNMRKVAALELLCGPKVAQFEAMRAAEVGRLVGGMRAAAAVGEAVDVTAAVASATADMTCLMVMGRKVAGWDFGGRGFGEVMAEAMEEAAAFNLADYFPVLRWVDLHGSTRRLKRLGRVLDAFLERIVDEHVAMEGGSHDLVDAMLAIVDSGNAAFEFNHRSVKAVVLDMLLAGTDTSSASVEWALSELIKNPKVMKKLQKELEEIVGPNQMVEESHLSSLKYLDCVIKESMRLHPAVPMAIHESMEQCEVDGLHIPNRARVLVNIWAIGRDPDAWSDPERFSPERFFGSNVDVRGRDFQLIPFGSGRRGCPGVQLALVVVKLMVAQLVHCFDWVAPADLDMSEKFGLVVTRAKHLELIPICRSGV